MRTLFVSGLPMDAKPRELYLLFRAYKVSATTIEVSLIASLVRRMVIAVAVVPLMLLHCRWALIALIVPQSIRSENKKQQQQNEQSS